MKNTIVSENNLGYSGVVDIKLVRGDKVIKHVTAKNAGRLPLFTFITKCLAGNFSSGQYDAAPKFLMIGFTNNPSSISGAEAVSLTPIPYTEVGTTTSPSGQEDEYGVCTYKFVIPFSTVSSGAKINHLRLYNSNVGWDDLSGCCAWVTLFDESTGTIDNIEADGKSNIILTWSLRVSNK